MHKTTYVSRCLETYPMNTYIINQVVCYYLANYHNLNQCIQLSSLFEWSVPLDKPFKNIIRVLINQGEWSQLYSFLKIHQKYQSWTKFILKEVIIQGKVHQNFLYELSQINPHFAHLSTFLQYYRDKYNLSRRPRYERLMRYHRLVNRPDVVNCFQSLGIRPGIDDLSDIYAKAFETNQQRNWFSDLLDYARSSKYSLLYHELHYETWIKFPFCIYLFVITSFDSPCRETTLVKLLIVLLLRIVQVREGDPVYYWYVQCIFFFTIIHLSTAIELIYSPRKIDHYLLISSEIIGCFILMLVISWLG